MIINTTTTVAFKVPHEYKQAMKFKEEHPNWKDESDTNVWRFTNMKTYYTVSMEVENFSQIGGDTE